MCSDRSEGLYFSFFRFYDNRALPEIRLQGMQWIFSAFCFRMADMKEMMLELEEIWKVQAAALEAARVQEVKQQGRSEVISLRREGV